MEPLPEYSFARYLTAKKSVDDRALNQYVWQTLKRELPPGTPEKPVQVLEIGAGIGAMFERALEWGLLTHASYTALDYQVDNITWARKRLDQWGQENSYQVANTLEGDMVFHRTGRRVSLHLQAIDLFEFIAQQKEQSKWDLIIAHAFLDLVDIPTTLPQLFSLSKPMGLYYFTINFDGATLLEPPINPELDDMIQRLYHDTMDNRIIAGKPSGDSQAGRRLFTHLRDAGTTLLAAGASDWVVFATEAGYPQDEAYFLHFIVHTIHQALVGNPKLNPSLFKNWVAQRHNQIDRGELIYITHQLDFAGRVR